VGNSRIGVKFGERGYEESDVGSCKDSEMVERAGEFLVKLEVAEFVIESGHFEFHDFLKGSGNRFGIRYVVLCEKTIDVYRLRDRESMLWIVVCDVDAEEASDFAFVDNFDFMHEFGNDRVASRDRRAADEDVVDIDTHDDISTDVNAWVSFQSSESHTYNHL